MRKPDDHRFTPEQAETINTIMTLAYRAGYDHCANAARYLLAVERRLDGLRVIDIPVPEWCRRMPEKCIRREEEAKPVDPFEGLHNG